MSDNFVGLTSANALAQGGQNLGTEAQNLQAQLQSLISDMSRDKDAIRGDALGQFQAARSELERNFSELLRWCANNGVKLGDAQTQVNTTDSTSADAFATAASAGAALSAPMNR
ncbi:hypothetical protein [Nakamurella sp.]|uniref:hypothetical protein n=1 Tax=Nakamurella sp. TaxID=1869182 RepID=UPI003783CDAB